MREQDPIDGPPGDGPLSAARPDADQQRGDTDVEEEASPRTQHRLHTRIGWTVFDQALSSLTNFALSIVVARAVDASSFGAFSVAFAVFSFVLGMSRAIAAEPLVVRFSAARHRDVATASSAAAGLALTFGAVAGGVCIAAAFVVGGDLGAVLPALGIVLPGLLLQDTWRYAFFAAKRPASAAANDFAWAVLQFSAIAVLILIGLGVTPLLVLAWGGAAAGASVYGLVQMGVRPAPRRALQWLRDHRDLAPLFLVEYVLTMGFFNLALVSIGFVGTLADVGALRAAQVLLGPLQLLFFSANSVAVPEFVRRLDRPDRTLLGYAGGLSALLALVGVTWTAILLAIPDAWGVQLLGDSWAGARTVLPASGAHMVAIAVALGATYMLRSLADGRRVLRASAVQSPLVLAMGVGGVLVGGALGAAIGFAVAHWIGAAVWWMFMIRSLRRRRSGPAQP